MCCKLLPARQRHRALSARITGRAALVAFCLGAGGVAADANWPDDARVTLPGVQLLEGDIFIDTDQATARGIGLRGPTSPWPDGIVPYQIDASLSKVSAELVREAIADWNEVSGVSLMPLGEAPVDLQGSHILFQLGPGCASWVGQQGGEQPLWVGPTCSAGSIMHEIGHALGLEHEHTRPDRDEHIIIHHDKIDPTKLHNFEITDFRSRILGPYDYESIMHYGPSFFSLDGSTTMEPLVPTEQPIGQRIAPSAGDLNAIAMLYGTDLSLVAEAVDLPSARAGAGTDIDVLLHVTNERDQGANGLLLTLQTQGLEVIGKDDDEWRCERTATEVTCHLERLQGSARSTFSLALRGQLDEDGLYASLASVTPDQNAANNQAIVRPPEAAGISADAVTDKPGVGSEVVMPSEPASAPAAFPVVSTDEPAVGMPAELPDEFVSQLPDKLPVAEPAAALPAAASTAPISAAPQLVEPPVPLFEQAPIKQVAPPAVAESSDSAVGAFACWWLLLVVWVVRRRLALVTGIVRAGFRGRTVNGLRFSP